MFSPKTQHTTKPTSSKPNGGGSFIQPKLNVGKPGDKYEVEADKAADEIIAKGKETPNSFFAPTVQKKNEEEIQKQESNEQEVQQKPLVDSISPVVQLASENNLQKEEEEVQKSEDENTQQVTEENLQAKEDNTTSFSNELIQQKPEEEIQEKEEEEVQEKEEEEVQQLQMAGGDDNSSLEGDLSSSKGGGSSLPSNTQNEMESGFGADFSGVRIHNDSNAVQMNKKLGSQAFTNGNDIYFNEGKYNPSSESGKHLLAHELTHTVQQGASPAVNNVQKSEGGTDTVTLVAPTQSLDITNGLQLSDDWLAYIEQESRTTNFDVNVKIGAQFEGTIKIRKLGRPAEGQTQKFELSRNGGNKHLDVRGMSFLNPLRDAGVFPVLVLNSFGEEQSTTGFLSIRTGENVFTRDALGIIHKINENLEAMSFLGLSPIEVAEGLENRFENGGLNFRANNLSANIDGYIEAIGSLGITDSNLSFELNSTVDIAGLASGEFNVARGADGKLSGQANIAADIANISASLTVEYDDGAVTIQGTGRMNSEKFSGEITLLVTDATRSRQMMHAALGVESMNQEAEAPAQEQVAVPKTKSNQVLAGWGEVQATITPWLQGTAKIGIDHLGHVTIVGEVVVTEDIELMEQRGKKVDIFEVEIRAGYGIPLVGQVFLFASIGMFANAGFGPLVLKDVGFTGTYSTDPSVLQNFSITGTLGINAFAVLGLEAEAGVGVTLIGHDVKAGVNVTAAAGLRAYAEATPTFEYKEEHSPEGGKIGESRLKGHFEAAAQLFLQLSGALFYELDSPWWSPAPDGREEYPLGEVQYPIGDSLGIGADVDWLVGGEEPPELTMSPVEFDPDKFTADVMADPPPRSMGDSESSPEGEWQGENANSNQTENPEITGEGEGLPPGRREEDLSNLSEEQKYMRALDELSQMENANPKPTIGVVEDKINTVKRRYGIRKIQTRNEEAESVAVYVEHGEENNSRHLLQIPLMSEAERQRLIDAAKEELQRNSRRAADEEGKISRAEAEEVLNTIENNHDVILEAQVLDGQNTWDYLIDTGGRDQTEGGNLKKETEVEEATNENNLENLSQIAVPFTETDGDNHTLRFAVEGGAADLMVHSTPKDIFKYLNSDEVDQSDRLVQDARRLATEIKTMANNAADTEGLVTNLNSKMRELSEMMSEIRSDFRRFLPRNPVYNYTPQNNMAYIAEADMLSANRSGGTPPGGSYVAGWQAIQQGLTTGGGHWKRLHLINQGFGGFGVPENLTPGTQSDNSEYEKFDGPVKERVGSRPNDESAQGVVKIKATVTYYSGEFPTNQQAPKQGRGVDQFADDGRVKKDNYADNIKFEAWEYSYNKGANSWTLGGKFVDDNLGIDLPDWNLVSPPTIGAATKSEYTRAYNNLSVRDKFRVDSVTSVSFDNLLSPTILEFIRGKSFGNSVSFRGQMDLEIDPSTSSKRRRQQTIDKLESFRDIIPVMVNANALKF
ncbi:DUF4157 domain-containing protein [Tenacibaculum mesophilum]|uniref:DUF4157 domain-containing protein n=1 Tax=Tenacibaculum mesophilum TaxID=104268 RepID=A0AAE9MNN1_9FLAO|nr:DUF4157 domain-containing protein [Tenacibaculum mesophilum]UTD15369.1 DUF4157 domain-containing protein [Tenacibaculum mesophilum]